MQRIVPTSTWSRPVLFFPPAKPTEPCCCYNVSLPRRSQPSRRRSEKGNRLGATLGAGKAADGLNDKVRALQHYRAALALAKDTPSAGRVELVEARKFISTGAN